MSTLALRRAKAPAPGSRSPSSGWRVLLLLFVVGTGLAVLVQWQFALQEGGWTSLLHVGEESTSRAFIEQDLGEVHIWDEQGHDGKFSYVIARDPFGRQGLSDLVDLPAYRYRRYLYSVLGGAFGLATPHVTLAGLVAWAAIGVGLATAATADIARHLNARRWSFVGASLNAGIWSSAVLLTSDALAFGLGLVGVAACLRRRFGLAVLTLIGAGLTKEVYLVVALGMAAHLWQQGQRKQSVQVAVVPATIVFLWNLALSLRFGAAASTNGAIGAPFLGLFDAATRWHADGFLLTGVLTLVALVVAPVVAWRTGSRLLGWLSMPWVVLALCSSEVVWARDAYRTFAALWLFMVLGLAVLFVQRDPSAQAQVPAEGSATTVRSYTTASVTTTGAKP